MDMEVIKSVEPKRGYLHSFYKYFHLKDQMESHFDYHYHDFCKIVIMLSGKVDYLVEGKSYRLQPWDILFINQSLLHRPIIDSSEVYERIIIWVDPKELLKFNSQNTDLRECFLHTEKRQNALLRLSIQQLEELKGHLSFISNEKLKKEWGEDIALNMLIVQLLIKLNRFLQEDNSLVSKLDIHYDQTIVKVMDYINQHLHEDIGIEDISKEFYLSKYHLMRKFKQVTGFSVHQYMLQKRLQLSKKLILDNFSMTEVSVRCGFSDYTNFFRAFKKEFGLSPKNYVKQMINQPTFEHQSDACE